MVYDELYEVLAKISALSVVIPLTFYLLRFKAIDRSLIALLCYLLFCGLADLFSFISLEYRLPIYIILNSFTALEFLSLFFLYYKVINKGKFTIIILISASVFFLVAIGRFAIQLLFNDEDNVVSTLASLIIAMLAGVCLYQQLINSAVTKLSNYHFFWINLAFLLYFSASFIIFSSNDFIVNSSGITAQIVWSIHQFLNIVANTLIFVGLCQTRRPRS
jgi:hypothetical protein